MTQQTSDHVKPCNIGQSEQHNRRNAEYLARINKSRIYIRTDLMTQNMSWSSPLIKGMTLTEYHAKLAAMVKEKTGRAMQTKERKKVDKKTGKVITVSGSSPIRESVVVCKADTTIEQLQHYCQLCHEQFGITALQIHIHRDEGHYENPGDKSTWKPNYHAHIVWDWMNHDTGKSCKLSREDMSRMQDMVAEALQMERGTSKEETEREHLERNDFIVAEQKRKSKMLDNETQIKKRISSELDSEIAEKQERCNTENGNAILSGIANLAGRGKYAAIAKENEELKASVPKRIAELQQQFKTEVDKSVEQRTKMLMDENEQYKERNQQIADKYNGLVDRFNAVLSDKQKAETALVEYKRGEAERFNTFAAQSMWKDDLLAMVALALAKVNQLFRQAINAIINFAKSCTSNNHQSFFSNEDATAIKTILTNYAKEPSDQRYVGKWLVLAAKADGNLSEREAAHAEKEVDDVVIGKYDWRINGNRLKV